MEKILTYLIDHFTDLLDLNLTASIVILFVISVRQLMKGAPKIFSYGLWAIVLLRLLVPLSIESPVSFVPEKTEFSSMVDVNLALPEMQFESPADRISNTRNRENTPPGQPIVQTHRVLDAQTYLTFLWLAGMGIMLAASFVSWVKLRRKVRVSVPFRKGIRIADDIGTPFVMGLFRPVIYLPGALDPAERKYIIAHERHHIRRGDHIFKALGFLALTIHWFNPLVWLSFVLAGRDMEMSCDEAVIRRLGKDVRAEYSASLLNIATGKRIFTGMPLAFGEGDPTGRIRNLVKWKKPARWVIILCVAVCVVMAVCLLTYPETETNGTDDSGQPITESPEPIVDGPSYDWGISIAPERVSRTGATAAFVYSGSIPGKEGAEAFYGDAYILERLDNGQWVPVEEIPGYYYFAEGAPYNVVDQYGMVHEWQTRFGELPDGHYRIGKPVTLRYPDGTSEEMIAYGTFSLPDDILTGPIPLDELPEMYSAEQAMIDGCFVMVEGVARENKDIFQEFADDARMGTPAAVRIVDWYYGDNPSWYAVDLQFDGSVYTITTVTQSYSFQYLKLFTGEKAWDNADHDAYSYYILVNDDTVTLQDIEGNGADRNDPPSHWVVCTEYFYTPKTPQLPSRLEGAVLEMDGIPLVSITDFDRLEKLHILFTEAQFLGYEPKTHSIGIGLNLILTGGDGTSLVIELDPDNDICRINGEYVFYGAYDEPNYIEKLWYYLGIDAWPETVYASYPNAYRP